MTRLVQHRRMQRPYLPIERLCAHCGARTLVPAAHFETCRAIVVEKMRAARNPVTQRVVRARADAYARAVARR